VRALLIPAFGPVEEVEQDGLDDLRRLVEGHIEALPMWDREDANAYVNEDGLLAGLPRNARATLLLGFPIAGSAVLCGFDAATGEQTAIPEDLARTVHAASSCTDPSRD
jgi:Domain of unknown function (DUF3846)